MTSWLDGDRLAWILGVCALLGTLAAFARWVRRKVWPRWRALLEDLRKALYTLIGHGPVPHPVTGEEIAPAEPGIAAQVAQLREQMRNDQSEIRSQLEFAIAKMHELEHEVKPNGGSSLKDGLNRVEARLAEGDGRFGEMASELAELRKSLGTLAEAQPQLWAAIEAIARATPPEDLGPLSGDEQPDL